MTVPRTLLFILAATLGLNGCGYPEVSPQAYELTKALYSACNRKSEEQLAKIDELIAKQIASKEIQKAEAEWLREIISNAESGDWESAMLECREIMEDQINRRDTAAAAVHTH